MAPSTSAACALGVLPRDALAHVPGCEQGAAPFAVEKLPGSSVNVSVRVTTRAGCFVVRLNHPAGATLGADHQRELILQTAAAKAGIAPPLVYAQLQAPGFFIMPYIAGRTWGPADFQQIDRLRSLGATLRRLHEVTVPAVEPFEFAALLRAHVATIVAISSAERTLLEDLLAKASGILDHCKAEGRQNAIVHNDLQHSNIISMRHLWLIDWEYAAVADPIFDLACVLAYYPNTCQHAQLLLKAAGLASCVSTVTLLQTSFLFVLVSFLWYRVRRLSGNADEADLEAERALRLRLA